MQMTVPASWKGKPSTWWSAMTSQMRDMVANDNRSDPRRMRDAQEMMRWARARQADGPEWAAVTDAAMQQAQAEMRRQRPRAC